MFATTVLCLAALAQAAPGRLETFRGMVIEKGTGRPLAGASVRFSDEPDAPTAITDAQGRFDGLPAGKVNAVPFEGQQGPPARLRAEDDRALPWEVIGAEGPLRYPPGYAKKQAIEALYERVETRWKGDGPGASLVVECPPVGAVEAVVRGPNGAPLADRALFIMPMADSPHPGAGIIRFAGRTDQNGTFRVRSFEGTRQFAVQAPGLGFGATGRVAVIGGQVARPAIPPLARFARVEGRLAPGLVAPGTTVALLTESFQQPAGPTAPCDEQGHFALADVVAGAYRIAALKDGRNVPTAYHEIRPEPGQVLGGVVLEPPRAPSPVERKATGRTLRQLNGDRNATITWAEGTIRDEHGQPLADASVYLHAQYHGGMRMMEQVKKTAADDRGRYRFEGPLLPSMGTLTIVASAKDRPPAIAYAPGPDAALGKDELKPARLDVTLGAAGASARVRVVRDGKPLAGVAARLSARGVVALADPGYRGRARGAERDEVTALLAPTAATGLDGVARFEKLFPGAFELVATDSPDSAQLQRVRWARDPQLAFAIAEGLAAAPGGTIETAVAVHRQPGTVRFRLLRPDGTPVVGQTVSLGFGRDQMITSTSLDIDNQGIGRHDFQPPGLWTVDLRFRDSAAKSFPIREEPFYQAEALIPVAPGLVLDDPVTLRAVHRDAGAIRARLLDAAGKPAKGAVMIVDNFHGAARQAGTVDADGWVRFADLPSGKYRLRGAVDGQARAPRPRLGATHFGDDAALRGHATVFDRDLTVAPGVEASVDLRLEPVGYVRATVRAPAGRSPSDYVLALVSEVSDTNLLGYEIDREGASYLFGPVPAGRWPIIVREKVAAGPYPKRGERPVVVEAGEVLRVEVEPEPSPQPSKAPQSRRQAFLGMGGIRIFDAGPEGLATLVFLSDGATPAFGARALFFPQGEREPSAEGVADGSGRLTWTGRWRYQPSSTEKGPEPVREPTVAAWMPGLAGPVVVRVEPDKPLRLVLPAPAGASGRVTLGGRGVEGRNARIRVVADAEDRGALAIAFDREATADADGRFTFPGLAPGRYTVQATRDDIWLSPAVPLVVEPGKHAAPLALDIPEPGAPVALYLVDDRTRPIPNRSFSIRRPDGPLAAALPMTYRTDARGSAIVRGLAVGRQALIADGDPQPHTFLVPAPRPGAAPQGVRVEVARPGP